MPEMRSDELFWSRQQVFLDHSNKCAKAMEKEELDGTHFLWPQSKVCHGERRVMGPRGDQWRIRCRHIAVSSRVFSCRNSSSSIARTSRNFLCKIDWLSLRGIAQPKRCILPNLLGGRDGAAAGRAIEGSAPRRAVSLPPQSVNHTDRAGVRVLGGHLEQPFVSAHALTRGSDGWEMETKLDSRRTVSPGCKQCSSRRQRIGVRLSFGH